MICFVNKSLSLHNCAIHSAIERACIMHSPALHVTEQMHYKPLQPRPCSKADRLLIWRSIPECAVDCDRISNKLGVRRRVLRVMINVVIINSNGFRIEFF